ATRGARRWPRDGRRGARRDRRAARRAGASRIRGTDAGPTIATATAQPVCTQKPTAPRRASRATGRTLVRLRARAYALRRPNVGEIDGGTLTFDRDSGDPAG